MVETDWLATPEECHAIAKKLQKILKQKEYEKTHIVVDNKEGEKGEQCINQMD